MQAVHSKAVERITVSLTLTTKLLLLMSASRIRRDIILYSWKVLQQSEQNLPGVVCQLNPPTNIFLKRENSPYHTLYQLRTKIWYWPPWHRASITQRTRENTKTRTVGHFTADFLGPIDQNQRWYVPWVLVCITGTSGGWLLHFWFHYSTFSTPN